MITHVCVERLARHLLDRISLNREAQVVVAIVPPWLSDYRRHMLLNKGLQGNFPLQILSH
ncbi:hypothetical protein D3C84_1200870 [compost metagenome]